jgi:hypothetical protein
LPPRELAPEGGRIGRHEPPIAKLGPVVPGGTHLVEHARKRQGRHLAVKFEHSP